MKRTEKQELVECIDNCCEIIPLVVITSNIKIDCMNCANGISIKGNTPKQQLEAMIEWNKQVRFSK